MNNVFIFMDYQNQPVDPDLIVKKIEESGKILGGKAYGHWSKYPATMFSFSRHGIELIEMPEDGLGNKKGNDIKLAVDAIETMFSLQHISSFVLVTGDADFVPLVKKLRMYGKTVFVIGRSKNTSSDMQLSADLYIPYEEIVKSEKINSNDSFEDIVDEVVEIIEDKNLIAEDNVVRRILNGMNANYQNIGYKSFNYFFEDVKTSVKRKTLKSLSELSEYEENYMRFLERIVANTHLQLNISTLEKIAESRHQWIAKNSSKESLKLFIENMILNGKLIKNQKNFLYVPAPKRWEIKYEKTSPYPEIRDKFVESIYNLFKENNVYTISEALHKSKDSLNLTNKVLGSFGMALKFSGMFLGEDGSDYVSLKTPVKLIYPLEEFRSAIEMFYLKKILKDEIIHEDLLNKISLFIYDSENTDKTLNLLNYLIKIKDVYYEKPYYKYKTK